MTDLDTIRAELDEVFQPAIRWISLAPAEREASDYLCGLSITVDLTWGGSWQVSQMREGDRWTVSASTSVNGHRIHVSVEEYDYLMALVCLHAGILRRIDRIETQVGKLKEAKVAA